MSTVATERVLVIPTSVFHRLGYFQGFSAEVERYLEELLSPEHTAYRPRGQMEIDPSFKQLIPYVIFRYVDEDGIVHVFQYTRGQGQGEDRLHRKRSIGIGGHISSIDAGEATINPYDEGLRRELDEEVAVATRVRERCVGLINDDQTEVGRVHLGVVHIFEVDEPHVTSREPDLMDAAFLPVAQLLADLDEFETWSQICLRALFPAE
ncbi:MAG: phosphoesterase [Pirellulales bacterium]